jgi:hypothetical protein
MGDLLGGGEQKAVVYGELPGMKEGAQTYLDAILKLMKTQTPAEGWITGQAGADQGLAGLARGREREMLQPGWTERTSPGLDRMFGSWRAQSAEDKAENDRALQMRFGGAGQTLSSPMVEAMAKARTQADRGLEERIGSTQYQDYGRKQGLVSGMLPGISTRALGEAGAANQLTYDKLDALMKYILASKGQMQMTQDSGGGLLGDILSAATGGWAGAIGKKLAGSKSY